MNSIPLKKIQNPRIFVLDSARALAAIMGVILHSACGYMRFPVPQWPAYTEKNHIVFDYITNVIHLFRVPVFFFLAGFFCYVLFQRLSFLGFIKNRFLRIALPFLLFWFLLDLPFLLVKLVMNQVHSSTDFFLLFKSVGHLWFLEYLIIYYVIYIVSRFIKNIFKIKSRYAVLTQKWLSSKLNWVPIISLNFIFLYYAGVWYTPILLDVIPNIWLLGIYGIYFLLGILVIKHGAFNDFFTFKWQNILLGFLGSSIYFYLAIYQPHLEIVRVLAIALYASSSYLLFSSFFSFCVKYFSTKNKFIRFISDASYWIYLSQIYFILLVHKYAVRYFSSIFVQFELMCIGTLFLSLATYTMVRIFRSRKMDEAYIQNKGLS